MPRLRGFGFECAPQFAIGGDAAGNQHGASALLFGCGDRTRDQVIDHRALKAGDQIQCRVARKRAQRIGAAFVPRECLLPRLNFGLELRIPRGCDTARPS